VVPSGLDDNTTVPGLICRIMPSTCQGTAHEKCVSGDMPHVTKMFLFAQSLPPLTHTPLLFETLSLPSVANATSTTVYLSMARHCSLQNAGWKVAS